MIIFVVKMSPIIIKRAEVVDNDLVIYILFETVVAIECTIS